ncbi:metalloregulator ArsR/SmtB family transcription factor [bacterium]|nr:metalloregulator ArsR/SmtB family transcription factor [bacterium]
MKQLLAITKALSDPSRIRILCALSSCGELCVCQIQELLDLAPSTTSRHMALLSSAGLVDGRRDGRWVHYRLADEEPRPGTRDLIAWLAREGAREKLVKADALRLNSILGIATEAPCQPQSPDAACCSSAPATPAEAKSPKASRGRSSRS